MSIDYDRLRELADKAPPGPWEVNVEETSTCGDLIEGLAAWIDADNEFVFGRGMEIEEDEELTNLAFAALAPDMARELLRLRDGVKALVVEKRMWVDQLCDPYEEVLNPDWLAEVGGEEPIGLALEKVCRQLTDLLEGDTE